MTLGPMPQVALELIPPALHGAVRDILAQYDVLWGGQLGRMDITPYRITLVEDSRTVRPQPYRTGLHHRDLIWAQLGKQAKLGVIEPSQVEWCSTAVLVPQADSTASFCVEHRRLKDITVTDTCPLPRMVD